jgi:hypothetical protein
MSSKSLIGFHAAYTYQNGAAYVAGTGNALIGSYLTGLGLPETAVIYMTTASPDKMAWLTPQQAQNIGVNLTVLELPPKAKPSEPIFRPIYQSRPPDQPDRSGAFLPR